MPRIFVSCHLDFNSVYMIKTDEHFHFHPGSFMHCAMTGMNRLCVFSSVRLTTWHYERGGYGKTGVNFVLFHSEAVEGAKASLTHLPTGNHRTHSH